MKEKHIEDKSITWLRAIAIIMVVTLHSMATTYYNSESSLRFGGIIINAFTRLSVPIFAMISGYLLWSKSTEPSLKLAFKRFWSIFKIITYFGIAYYLCDTFTGQGYYPFWTSFFNTESAGTHRIFLWYMFAILPLYTLTSFISLPLNKNQYFYIGFTIVLVFLFFLTESIKVAPISIHSAYSFNILFLYFLLGFSLGQLNFNHKKYWYLFFSIYIISSLTTGLCEWYLNPTKDERFFGNSTIFALIQSLSFFLFIRSLDFTKILSYKIGKGFDHILQVFAKYSVGIYGWHTIIQLTVYPKLQETNLRGTIVILLTLMLTLTGALLIAVIDYYFWRNINKRLAPCYNYINNKFTTLTKKYNI
ncbi:MAG: acyltransferase [Brevinema sp.]